MSKSHDLLFCKVAMTAGMVTQQQAQKVLALVDRREQETGRRPMIGAVFSKYQILTPQEVQRVTEAVRKRAGDSVVAGARGAGGGSGRGRSGGKPRGRPKKKKKPIDQQTLMMGVGFGVVFLGVVVALGVLFWGGGGDPGPVDSTGSGGSPMAASVGGNDDDIDDSDLGDELEAEAERTLSGDAIQDLHSRFGDVMNDRIENPARALTAFQAISAKIAEYERNGYVIPPDIQDRLGSTRSALADLEGGDGASPPPAPDPAAGDGSAEPETPPEPAAEPESDDDLGEIDLDDL